VILWEDSSVGLGCGSARTLPAHVADLKGSAVAKCVKQGQSYIHPDIKTLRPDYNLNVSGLVATRNARGNLLQSHYKRAPFWSRL
jgi:hypothetical protein